MHGAAGSHVTQKLHSPKPCHILDVAFFLFRPYGKCDCCQQRSWDYEDNGGLTARYERVGIVATEVARALDATSLLLLKFKGLAWQEQWLNVVLLRMICVTKA